MDFSGTQVTVTDVSSVGSVPVTYSFVDTAFTGATVSLVSDNFPAGVTETLVGDTLTLTSAEFTVPGTFHATFDITTVSVPGPHRRLYRALSDRQDFRLTHYPTRGSVAANQGPDSEPATLLRQVCLPQVFPA